MTRQWTQRLEGDGVFVHAMHLGWAGTKGVQEWMPVFRAVTRPFIRTPEQGADTIVWLSSTPESIQFTGRLCAGLHRPPRGYVRHVRSPPGPPPS
jgi:hypothetical protein